MTFTRVADAHELDFYPNAEVVDDGYSWLPDPEIDWRSIPYALRSAPTGSGVRPICCLDWQRETGHGKGALATRRLGRVA